MGRLAARGALPVQAVDGPPAVELHHLVPAILDRIPRTPYGRPVTRDLWRLLYDSCTVSGSAVTDEPLDLHRIDRPLDGLGLPGPAHAVEREWRQWF